MLLRMIAFALIVISIPVSASQPTPMQELTTAVGDRATPLDELDAKYGRLIDCSERPLVSFDNLPLAEERQNIYKWMFYWDFVKSDDGTCVYLQNPERRGLSRTEAQTLLSAITLPFPTDWMTPTCAHPFADQISAFTTDNGEGDGFTYSISYVVLDTSLAPLNRVQHEYASQLIDATAHARYAPGADLTVTVHLSVVFHLEQAGGFASLVAHSDAQSRAGTPLYHNTMTWDAWLLHVASGRLLRFDDLVQDASGTGNRIVSYAQPAMLKRLSQIYFIDPTEAVRNQRKDALAKEIIRVTTGPPHDWRLSLYFGEPCDPSLLITFGPTSLIPNDNERPDAHVSWKAMLPALKPQFRDAIPLAD